MLSEGGAVVGGDSIDDLVDSAAVCQFGVEDKDSLGGLGNEVIAIGVGSMRICKNGLCEGIQ